MKNNLKRITQSKYTLAFLAILGACLIVFPGIFKTQKQDSTDEVSYYSKILEERVEELILEMSDVDSVSVLITLENSGETVYAQNRDGNSSEYVLFAGNDGETGLKLSEINPTVRGIAVVCSNGDNIAVKEKITSMLASALGISTNRITVTG